MRNSRLDRILYIQQVLVQGGVLNKQQTADRFGVSEKTIQRDLDTLRSYFADSEPRREILYNSAKGGYLLDDTLSRFLTSSEILAVCKILLESRSMVKEEMFPILDKLVQVCTPLDRLNQVKDLISNERFHYVEPQHGRKFIESLWEIGTAVENHNVMEITYCRTHDGETRVRTIEPVGILFSEYYFYLAAFIEGIDKDKHFQNPQDNSPTIYRIDRIQNYKTLDRHFTQRYTDRFQEGEMRKRIQFMYGGELQTIRFEYTGPSLESVLDRLPTAKVLQVTEKALEFVRGQIKERTYLGADTRFVTEPEYPEFAWKELIVNAVAHRDYSIKGTDIQIKMFDDRLTVESPGTLPGIVRLNNMRHVHFSRNPKIAQFLHEYEYVQEFGEGVDRLYEVMETARLPQPEYRVEAFMLYATIRNTKLADNLGGPPQVTPQDTPQDKIIAYCMEPRSKAEIAKFCGFKDIKHFTAHYLKPLLESGQLRMTIPDKPNSRNQKYVAVKPEE